MPRVLITPEPFIHQEGPHTSILNDAGFEIVYPRDPEFTRGLCSESETIEQLSVADALLAGGEFVTANVLEQLQNLRVIARTGVGYDRIDIETATRRRVAVTITPTANHEAVAEHALALLFAVSKNVVVLDRQIRAGEWPRDLLQPIRGKTMGIFGLGRIGRSMAIRAAALGMTVVAHDPFPDKDFAKNHRIELVNFDTLVEVCDVMSVHCPCSDSTKGVLNSDVFARMKPTSILVNTSRGPVVNEADLVAALENGQLAGVGLDVFEQEPPAKDNPLFRMDNVVLTPHTAGLDAVACRDMAVEAAECVVKLYRGQWPEGAVVNSELKQAWQW